MLDTAQDAGAPHPRPLGRRKELVKRWSRIEGRTAVTATSADAYGTRWPVTEAPQTRWPSQLGCAGIV